MINYTYKKGKYIFCRDGVYFALTLEEIYDMLGILSQIKQDIENEQ